MGDREVRDSSWAGSYQHRLKKIGEEARAVLTKFQSEEPALLSPDLRVTDFSGTGFPGKTLEKIRESDLSHDERQRLITYLLGCWYLDQVEGEWAFVPMLVENPALYLSFGLGIKTGQGSMMNVAESAREILDGADLDFKEAFYTASSKVEQDHIVNHQGSSTP